MSNWESDNPFEGRSTPDLEAERAQLEAEIERTPVLENRLQALAIELAMRQGYQI